MDKVIYTVDSINQVLTYLGTRPFNDVAQLVQVLQSGQLIKEEVKDEPREEPKEEKIEPVEEKKEEVK